MRQFAERTIPVKKATLLEILKKNRIKHVEDYNEARELYLKAYCKLLKEILKKAEKEGVTTRNISIVEPVSYEKDYSQIIGMLEMSTEEQVEISASEYMAYVEDKWSWKESWASISTSYTGKQY